jgi:DNA modification methylase
LPQARPLRAPEPVAQSAVETLRLARRVLKDKQYYSTKLGTAFLGDALDLVTVLPDESVQAIITSPPFALRRKKAYGNPPEHEYVEWFLEFAKQFHRVLKADGSLVVEIGGAWLRGRPTRSIYQFKLLVELIERLEFHLAEDFYWFNKAKLPSPAQWVTVERVRVKDAVTPIWWLAKSINPKADNRAVLTPYSSSMERLLVRGYNQGQRPSGHVVGPGFAVDNGGAIPPNLIQVANTRSADAYQDFCRAKGLPIHPARFPKEVPEFFMRFITEPGDLVLDPFGGSNTTGAVAEELGRHWLTFELDPTYLDGSIGRFGSRVSARRAVPE